MNAVPSSLRPFGIDVFIRAEALVLRDWMIRRPLMIGALCVGTIVVGAGCYGAAIGSWRNEWQTLFTAIKLPLVILLTTLGNGLLNGMMAPLLGLNIPFRQTFVLVLLSFGVTSLILGGLSPIAWFVVWNTPPLGAQTSLSSPEYGLLQLTLATFTAFAGIMGNLRIYPLLKTGSHAEKVALRVLLSWLAANLFLGSQIAWVLRPFIWDPAGPVEFIGRQYFHGSFYETIFDATRRLLLL
jgi:hypothetical protein